jgi:hypothetical protein
MERRERSWGSRCVRNPSSEWDSESESDWEMEKMAWRMCLTMSKTEGEAMPSMEDASVSSKVKSSSGLM